MEKKQIIDVHCHLFNGGYALAELTSASWNLLKGTYPQGTREGLTRSRSFASLEGIREFAAYAARLLDAALAAPEGNFATQTESLAKSSLSGRELISVPLMMDIYYALDDNGRSGGSSLESAGPMNARSFMVGSDEGAAFDQHLERVRSLVARELDKLPAARARAFESQVDPSQELDKEMEKLRQRYLGAREISPRGDYAGIELSPGYRDHLEDLEALALDHPDNVFPFLAIDPRRPGIGQLLEKKLAKGQGVFRGVKLYPPLGYLPTHPNLVPVYDYCAQYDIPIITHCSLGGFENFRRKNLVESWTGEPHWENFTKSRKSHSLYYADPENWRPVLERWRDLRVDFGHFGGSRAKEAGTINQPWVETILDLMREYPNVYADLSYIANRTRQAETLRLIGQNDLLKRRILFGTDFIMVAMDRELGGLTEYFSNYAALDGALLYDNAARFLKLPGCQP